MPPQFFPLDLDYPRGYCAYDVVFEGISLAYLPDETSPTGYRWQYAPDYDTSTGSLATPTSAGYWVWTIRGGGRWVIHVPGVNRQGNNASAATQYFTVPRDENGVYDYSRPPTVVSITPNAAAERACPPLSNTQAPPAPPYSPNGEPPMCNCEETQDLLRLIARRLGTDSYPVTVPKSLVDSENTTEKQESLTELLFWTIKQMDGLAGQFPIEIEIKDADPSQQGDQARKVKVPNIAEGIAELLGLNIKTSGNSDIHTSFLMRLAAEVIATKNAALVTQDYAKANASYLGYKGNTVKRKVNYAFNVTKLENLERILEESEKNIIGWQDEDKNTVQAYLEKLMFAAGIIKQAFFRPNSQKDKLLVPFQLLIDG